MAAGRLADEAPATEAMSVSATEPDWSREAFAAWEWNPGRQLLRAIRAYQKAARGGLGSTALMMIAVARHRFWSAVAGADIPIGTNIGGGLLMPHPNGIVVHPDVVVGPNCLFFQQVTLGVGGTIPGVPRIGGHVDIGAGAKILGGVRIGDHAKIGANAVVLNDLPASFTAVGVPARARPPRGTP
jgi:serine O-acetyltransferase